MVTGFSTSLYVYNKCIYISSNISASNAEASASKLLENLGRYISSLRTAGAVSWFKSSTTYPSRRCRWLEQRSDQWLHGELANHKSLGYIKYIIFSIIFLSISWNNEAYVLKFIEKVMFLVDWVMMSNGLCIHIYYSSFRTFQVFVSRIWPLNSNSSLELIMLKLLLIMQEVSITQYTSWENHA